MNVSCSGCRTVFRVDPDKVPAAGVRARCSVCSAVFWVRREGSERSALPEVPGRRTVPPSYPVAESPSRAASPLPPPPAAPPWPDVVPPPFRAPAPVAAQRREAPAVGSSVAVASPATPPLGPSAALPPPPGSSAPPSRRANPFLAQDPRARARRLARALVSDIVVYNPAKRRDGLRDGSLKLLFEEEVRKSWEEYLDQVGRELAESTPYFTEALNEILADGRPVF